jgi:hypothetical protein
LWKNETVHKTKRKYAATYFFVNGLLTHFLSTGMPNFKEIENQWLNKKINRHFSTPVYIHGYVT